MKTGFAKIILVMLFYYFRVFLPNLAAFTSKVFNGICFVVDEISFFFFDDIHIIILFYF